MESPGIPGRFKAAKQRCDGMKGNEKDVCTKQAKADEKRAKADAKARRDSRIARGEAREEKREANVSVAKEKCENLSGDAKDRCMAQARSQQRVN